MNQRIRWGVLGCAVIAETDVLPAMQHASNGIPFAIAGRRKERVEEFADRFGFVRQYNAYDDLLDDPDVDAVYIPLPNALHKEWVVKALKKKKPVLCEKPMVCTADEAREIKRVSEEQNVPVMEAFAYRHSPVVTKIKELLSSGSIGEIRTIETIYTFMQHEKNDIRYDPLMGGGAILDVGAYNVNFTRMITGETPEIVAAVGRVDEATGVDVSMDYMFRHPSGIVAIGQCAIDCPLREQYRIIGSDGIIDVNYDYNAKGTVWLLLKNDLEERYIKIVAKDNYMLELEQFGRVVLNQEKPVVSIEETIANTEILEELIRRAHAKDRV